MSCEVERVVMGTKSLTADPEPPVPKPAEPWPERPPTDPVPPVPKPPEPPPSPTPPEPLPVPPGVPPPLVPPIIISRAGGAPRARGDALSCQCQIDYGAGYEDVYPEREAAARQEEDAAAWLALVEAEGSARGARVLSGGQVVAERVLDCVVVETPTHPGGGTRYLVHCTGGEVAVEEESGVSLSGSARPGYVGDAERALERAFKAVRSPRGDQ